MRALGIDLGTSLSSAAILEDEKPLPLRIATAASLLMGDSYCLPSSIFVEENGEILLGQAADNSRMKNPTRYRKEFKRDLGASQPYKIGDLELLPEDLYKEFFKYFKTMAEQRLGGSVEKVVVTHPANFAGFKKELIKKAGQMSGFSDIELIDEPTAAAIYYSSREKVELGEKILVYDLGGGTFDVSLIEKEKDGFRPLTPPLGIERCGGVDFQRKIYENIVSGFEEDTLKLLNSKNTIGRQFSFMLETESIKIKHLLSTVQKAETVINLPGSFEFKNYQLSRDIFEEMIKEDIEATSKLIEDIVKNAGIKMSDLDKVLLVGGSSRIPYVEKIVSEITGKTLNKDADTELVIALGAAINAGAKLKSKQQSSNNAKAVIEKETVKQNTIEAQAKEEKQADEEETINKEFILFPERYKYFFKKSAYKNKEKIAIEIGSSYCKISYMKNGTPTVIPNLDMNGDTPVFICFYKGNCFIGKEARELAFKSDAQVITDINNLIRLKREVVIDGNKYSPELLYAFFIEKLKENAEQYLQKRISQVVLVVPSYFSQDSINEIQKNSQLAEVKVIKVLESCTAQAAAFAYYHRNIDTSFVLCNVGSTHTEAAIFRSNHGTVEVITKLGSNLNGEADFIRSIVNYLITQFKVINGIDLSNEIEAKLKIWEAAEGSLVELQKNFITRVNIPNIINWGGRTSHLFIELRKSEYASMTSEINNRIANFCLSFNPITYRMCNIILTGDGARTPLIRERIQSIGKREVLLEEENRYQAVLGGAIQIDFMSNNTK